MSAVKGALKSPIVTLAHTENGRSLVLRMCKEYRKIGAPTNLQVLSLS